MWFGAPGLQTPFGTPKKGVVVDVKWNDGNLMIFFHQDVFMSESCFCWPSYHAKIFEAIKQNDLWSATFPDLRPFSKQKHQTSTKKPYLFVCISATGALSPP